ncbi:MAG: LysR family transcriptional regulator [Alphaproteobacteria bacterium]|nr:LysR family transcriptional regulator [Alphaproteobacteria bacterium]
MQSDPPETSELQAFVRVVEGGSVATAARELGLPRATVSRRLARLEERLGARLLHRTTRKQGLTDAGDELYRHARIILAAVSEAEEALRRHDDVPRGLVRVSLPPPDSRFHGLLSTFLERCPEVQVEAEWSSRYVDLVAEGFDVAVRAGHSPLDEGLIARRIGAMCTGAWASEAYLEAHGVPRVPADLDQHTCLLGFAQGVRPVTHWPLRDGGQVRVRGRLVTNDIHSIAHAAGRGLGIALLPDIYARSVADGPLVQVLADHVGAGGHLSIVYAAKEFMPAAVRAFVDHVVEAAAAMPDLG